METVPRAAALRPVGERGAAAIQYALLLSLIAVAIVGTVVVLGARLAVVFDAAATGLATPGLVPPAPAATASVAPPDVHYENCDAVRAAGADPIHVGDPGYSTELDPDGDGVGCE